MTPGTETDQAADVITTTVIGMRFRFIYLVSFHFFFFSCNGLLFVGLCSRIMKLIMKRIKKCSQAINYIFCKDSVIHWIINSLSS